jgi:hypothetical protein
MGLDLYIRLGCEGHLVSNQLFSKALTVFESRLAGSTYALALGVVRLLAEAVDGEGDDAARAYEPEPEPEGRITGGGAMESFSS